MSTTIEPRDRSPNPAPKAASAYAFSSDGLAALRRLRGRRLLAAFDFDGTLAPIALRPEQVITPPGVRAALDRLRRCCATAVISGRARDDVGNRLGVEVDHVVGNHGIDGLPGAEREIEECIAVSRGWLAQLHRADALRRLDPGLLLEDKRVSLSVHYRQARDTAQAAAKLPAVLARLQPPPRIVTGKMVFNLLPPSAVDKGTAMLRLLELTGAEAGLYVGDDVTDEDVFRLHQPDLLTIRVGRDDSSQARLYLRAPSEIPRLIDVLIGELEAKPAHRPRQPRPAAG
jgi:trehalose 6-phosphate phosphatase